MTKDLRQIRFIRVLLALSVLASVVSIYGAPFLARTLGISLGVALGMVNFINATATCWSLISAIAVIYGVGLLSYAFVNTIKAIVARQGAKIAAAW